MSSFHSIVSRRDFMKALGLAGAGVGTTAAVAPVFRDLDEVISTSAESDYANPWWVKEVDQPTTEIDWNILQRFQNGSYNNFTAHLTTEEVKAIQAKTKQEAIARMTSSSKPGQTLRDKAIKEGGWAGVWYRMAQPNLTKDLVEGWDTVPTPEMLGVPKWQGTPEEASNMITQALRFFGASSVSFAEINENTRKMIWAQMPQGTYPDIIFEEAPKPSFNSASNKVIIPDTGIYAVVHTVRQSLDTSSRVGYLSDGAAGQAYDNCDIAQWRLQAFLKVLGYFSVSQNLLGNGPIVGWGVMSGLGELGRLAHLITPGWGPMIRQSTMNIVNLPVAPKKPIDFGAKKFCITCKKCADLCPSGALSKETELTWDIVKPYDSVKPNLFNNPGLNNWPFDHFKCNRYWNESDTYCGVCQAVCVFSKDDASSVHEIVKATLAKTTMLNSFFVNMDKGFGYGLKPEDTIEEWWTNSFPVNGIHYDNDAYYN
ncbi:reductive dehalogenase [Dehalococcoides mccartyi]|uniref:reductive dehalogenase n=1 Tax=Dehalococcoides mccartyi TaxID=61435 RepID=UPI0004E0925D|nr:reductive dehalogenase [Dehalococcoides mccartyi]AII60305.1 dehalogenase [Dehalococcoides mccartyi CG5]